jgi:hypothetical protein
VSLSGLHLRSDLESKLDAMRKRLQDDWHALDSIPAKVLTLGEEMYCDDVKVSLEAAAARLDMLIKLNEGKRTSDWK